MVHRYCSLNAYRTLLDINGRYCHYGTQTPFQGFIHFYFNGGDSRNSVPMGYIPHRNGGGRECGDLKFWMISINFNINHVILFLCIPVEIAIHEAGHYYAAKYFNCYERFELSLRGKEGYLAAVFTTQEESVSEYIVINLSGVFAGVVFACLTSLITTEWMALVYFSYFTSFTDLSNLYFWYIWGKTHGYDNPMWYGPHSHWIDKKKIVELYRGRVYSLKYIEKLLKPSIYLNLQFHSSESVYNLSIWEGEKIKIYQTSDLSLNVDSDMIVV